MKAINNEIGTKLVTNKILSVFYIKASYDF